MAKKRKMYRETGCCESRRITIRTGTPSSVGKIHQAELSAFPFLSTLALSQLHSITPFC